jgi:hypothetical protein
MSNDFKLFIVLDGLFLLDWQPASLSILIAAVHGHQHTVANDTVMEPKKRSPIPAAQDYVVTGLAASDQLVNPFPPDFDVNHLSVAKSAVAAGVKSAGNPHALITVNRLPDAIFGAERHSVAADVLLHGADPAILKAPREQIVFCEKTILAYKEASVVELASASTGKIFQAVKLNDGRQMLALFSRPADEHAAFHGGEFNELLTLRSSRKNPDLRMTGIPPGIATKLSDDPEVKQLGLPKEPTPTGIETVKGTGCGDFHLRP